MSYSRNRLSTLAYANGFTLWHYKGCDGLQQIRNPKDLQTYFKPAGNLLRDGDLVLMSHGAHSMLVVRKTQKNQTDPDFLPLLPEPANDPEPLS